jgi:predicted alpha/beta-fold hydrolase
MPSTNPSSSRCSRSRWTTRAALAARRQPADHLGRALRAPLRRAAAGVPRERWTAPDGDFIDVDFVDAPLPGSGPRPLLVLFHGLEGSSRSHYAEAFADVRRERGMAFAVPHFRGCSGELNLAPRAYHSGDFEEIGWILRAARAAHAGGPVLAAGVSLGGNALMRWAGEAGDDGARRW